jgi:hypothetical protein
LALGLGALCLLAVQSQAAFLKQQTTQQNAWEPDQPKTNWACYFGTKDCAGGGANGISDATKTQVADILKGIISNLSKHKALVEMSAKDLQAGLKQETNPEVKKAMLGLIGAFKTDRKQATLVVSRLTNAPKASLAGISSVLSKAAPEPAPQGPIVKK